MTQLCIYGPGRGNGSWRRVAAGMVHGLSRLGALAGFAPIDQMSHELEDALQEGYDAPVGVHVGPPEVASAMQGRGAHAHRLCLLASNSSWLPAGAMTAIERESITGYVAISRWNAKVLRRYTELPIYLCHCGLSPWFRPVKVDREPGFAVLHLASTSADRKGTRTLIKAWAQVLRSGEIPRKGSRLRMVCDAPSSTLQDTVEECSEGAPWLQEHCVFLGRVDLDEERMAWLYCNHDLVCQPSRAEGFGMVPLEARACGVPVVMTDGTGHDAHCRDAIWAPDARIIGSTPGAIIVPVGPEAPIDDGPDAVAPTVEVQDLAQALIAAYSTRDTMGAYARLGAARVQQTWSWERVCARFLDELVQARVLP